MFVKHTIGLSTITGDTYVNIPIQIQYQLVDNAELIERLFVEKEEQKAVNPILNYDKVRFTPLDKNGKQITHITYSLNFLNANNSMQVPTYYSNVDIKDPFNNDDIKFKRNNFKNSYLKLSFYDSDNVMTQNLVNEVNVYRYLTDGDRYQAATIPQNSNVIAGTPLPVTQIPVRFYLSNPYLIKKGYYDGFYLYNYKDEYVINAPKYLYMKGTYFNAKSGKVTNLMTENIKTSIDLLVNKLYTRYKLYRDTTGFYYNIDDTYSTNVTYNQTTGNPATSDMTINLYQIQAS
jgi:hypothetical protein